MASSCSCSMMAKVCTSVCPLGESNSDPNRVSLSSSSSEQPPSTPPSNPGPSIVPLSHSPYCKERKMQEGCRKLSSKKTNYYHRIIIIVLVRELHLVTIISRRPPASAVCPPDHHPTRRASVASWEWASTLGVPQLRGAPWKRSSKKGGGKWAHAARPMVRIQEFICYAAVLKNHNTVTTFSFL